MQEDVIHRPQGVDLLAPVEHQREPDNRKSANLTFQCTTHEAFTSHGNPVCSLGFAALTLRHYLRIANLPFNDPIEPFPGSITLKMLRDEIPAQIRQLNPD